MLVCDLGRAAAFAFAGRKVTEPNVLRVILLVCSKDAALKNCNPEAHYLSGSRDLVNRK
jgi:hypothetical protein